MWTFNFRGSGAKRQEVAAGLTVRRAQERDPTFGSSRDMFQLPKGSALQNVQLALWHHPRAVLLLPGDDGSYIFPEMREALKLRQSIQA